MPPAVYVGQTAMSSEQHSLESGMAESQQGHIPAVSLESRLNSYMPLQWTPWIHNLQEAMTVVWAGVMATAPFENKREKKWNYFFENEI